jgi:hypothetical protein
MCHKCKQLGHFQHCCKTEAVRVVAAVAVEEVAKASAVTGDESGSFFCLRGAHREDETAGGACG